MAERDCTSPQRFPTRRSYLLLALGLVSFVLYGSLLPFEFERRPLADAWQEFEVLLLERPRRLSRSDILANTLLFVPIGFTLAGALVVDRVSRWRWAALPLVLPAAFLTSMAAEFLQMFASDRVPSGLDVAAQAAGSAIGIVVWLLIGQAATDWIRDAGSTGPTNRLARVLTAYAAGWVFINLAPFDITVDPGDIAERVRTGRISIMPFAGAELTARWVWDAFVETCAAVPIGVMMIHRVRDVPLRRVGLAAAAAGALILVVEVAQALIESHASSLTDLLFAWSGAAIGIAAGHRLFVRAGAREDAMRSDARGRLYLIGIVVAVALLCAYSWQPYDFVVNNDLIRAKLGRVSLIPFAAYTSGSYLNALNNLLVDIALSVPLGIALGGIVYRTPLPQTLAATIAVMMAAAVFTVIELGQFFLPTRTPDPTDVVLGTAGVYAGLRLARWLNVPPSAP